MNGRDYDPTLGRFISADPVIDGPENSQSYNRYSYVNDNPLTYTDPTGYWKIKIGPLKFGKSSDLRAIVAVGVGFLTYGAASGWIGSGIAAVGPPTAAAYAGMNVAAGALAGFAGDVVATGTLDGGLQGAVSGGIAGGIAVLNFPEYLKGVVAGTVQGARGRDGAAGFLRGFVGGYLNYELSGSTAEAYGRQFGPAAQLAVLTVVGGTTSVIGGGKFSNGALTAAFHEMFRKPMFSEFDPDSNPLTTSGVNMKAELVRPLASSGGIAIYGREGGLLDTLGLQVAHSSLAVSGPGGISLLGADGITVKPYEDLKTGSYILWNSSLAPATRSFQEYLELGKRRLDDASGYNTLRCNCHQINRYLLGQ